MAHQWRHISFVGRRLHHQSGRVLHSLSQSSLLLPSFLHSSSSLFPPFPPAFCRLQSARGPGAPIFPPLLQRCHICVRCPSITCPARRCCFPNVGYKTFAPLCAINPKALTLKLNVITVDIITYCTALPVIRLVKVVTHTISME